MQESLDQLNKSRADETQLEDLKVELSRIKNMEPLLEKLKVISLSFNAVHSCVASFFLCIFALPSPPLTYHFYLLCIFILPSYICFCA